MGTPRLNEECQPIEEIALAILDYLLRNPDAKDSVEGISEWWVQETAAERKRWAVESALSFLHSRQLIVETRRDGLAPFYRVNPRKSGAIGEILKRNGFS